MSKMLTSREVMDATGITGQNTLIRYHQAGLIPPPQVKKHPSGRGMTSYWPEWVVYRCQRIREHSDRGKTREEIREFLGTDWTVAEKEFFTAKRTRRTFAEVCSMLDRRNALEELRESVVRLLCDWGSYLKPNSGALADRVLDEKSLKHCIEMMQQGVRPVLVLDGNEAILTADIAIGYHACQRTNPDETFMVIPLSDSLCSMLKEAADAIGECRTEPTPTVVQQDEGGPYQRSFSKFGRWGFDLGPCRKLRSKTPSTKRKATKSGKKPKS